MNRTILAIVVIGVVVVALIFAFNQDRDPDVVVAPEITENITPVPEATENLTVPNNESPAPGSDVTADGNPDTPQQ